MEASPNDGNVTFPFPFTNTGDAPVTITKVKSSCGCTTTELAKETYAAGESGEIVATLHIGSRQGLQVKKVWVYTDDSEEPVVLTMKTDIPKLLEISPAFVRWEKGSVPEPQVIDLKVGLPEGFQIVSAESGHSDIATELETIEIAQHYRLTLYPLSTDAPVQTRVALKTDFPTDTPKTFYVFAHIREATVAGK